MEQKTAQRKGHKVNSEFNRLVLQLLSVSILTGYLSIEYLWPFIKRHWWGNSEIQRRLQVQKHQLGGWFG